MAPPIKVYPRLINNGRICAVAPNTFSCARCGSTNANSNRAYAHAKLCYAGNSVPCVAGGEAAETNAAADAGSDAISQQGYRLNADDEGTSADVALGTPTQRGPSADGDIRDAQAREAGASNTLQYIWLLCNFYPDENALQPFVAGTSGFPGPNPGRVPPLGRTLGMDWSPLQARIEMEWSPSQAHGRIAVG